MYEENSLSVKSAWAGKWQQTERYEDWYSDLDYDYYNSM